MQILNLGFLGILILLGSILHAQNFREVPPASPFEGVQHSSIAFSDVDGDGDEDLVITGDNTVYGPTTKLYLNDNGNFTEVLDSLFKDVQGGDVAFSDIDGDGDEDLLVTGSDEFWEPTAILYINDEGNFTEVLDTPFMGVRGSSVAFSDVDGDGDEDLLITGLNSLGAGGQTAKLYANEAGTFNEVMDTPFEGVWNGAVAFSDVDGDGDQDLMIVGENKSEAFIAKLYTNNEGSFTEVLDTPFEGVEYGSVAFADVDGDGDSDLLITGWNIQSEGITKLYSNDGGNFTLVSDTPFGDVPGSSATFSDTDGDGDQDLLIVGLYSKLYTNDEGSFSELMGTPFESVSSGSIAFSDIDGDEDPDLVITGRSYEGELIAKLYLNEEGNFTELINGTTIDGIFFSSVAFADIDGDGDKDLIITGRNSLFDRVAKLYLNDAGRLISVMGSSIEGVESGSVAFSDVDGDGDQDLLVTGKNESNQVTAKLYTNDMGSFTEVLNTPFEGVFLSSVAFADVDNDGDNDLMITGTNSSWMGVAKLYTNEGGNFSEVMGTPFEGVGNGSIAFSDVDGDGDQDLMITGEKNPGESIAKLYTNAGGSFTEVMDTPFVGVRHGAIAFADIDGDGDSDLLITGQNSAFAEVFKLYTNDGGSFTEFVDIPSTRVAGSSVAFSDVDGDGDQDLMITGETSSGKLIAKLYVNDAGNFTEFGDTPFEGVRDGAIAFADVDGDGDNDLLITGLNNLAKPIAQLFSNEEGISSVGDLIIEPALDFTPFPNPSKATTLYLKYNSTENGNVTIKVRNVTGVLLRQQREFSVIGPQVFSIDITSLVPGSYFVELNNGKRRGIVKFIVL